MIDTGSWEPLDVTLHGNIICFLFNDKKKKEAYNCCYQLEQIVLVFVLTPDSDKVYKCMEKQLPVHTFYLHCILLLLFFWV